MFLGYMNLKFVMIEHQDRLRRAGSYCFMREVVRKDHAELPVHSIMQWLLHVGGKLHRRRIFLTESAR